MRELVSERGEATYAIWKRDFPVLGGITAVLERFPAGLGAVSPCGRRNRDGLLGRRCVGSRGGVLGFAAICLGKQSLGDGAADRLAGDEVVVLILATQRALGNFLLGLGVFREADGVVEGRECIAHALGQRFQLRGVRGEVGVEIGGNPCQRACVPFSLGRLEVMNCTSSIWRACLPAVSGFSLAMRDALCEDPLALARHSDPP